MAQVQACCPVLGAHQHLCWRCNSATRGGGIDFDPILYSSPWALHFIALGALHSGTNNKVTILSAEQGYARAEPRGPLEIFQGQNTGTILKLPTEGRTSELQIAKLR